MRFQHGRYYLVIFQHGKRKWISLSRTFGRALKQYYELQPGRDTTDRSFLNLYQRYRQHEFYLDLAESTKARYQYAFQAFLPCFQESNVQDIRPADIWEYLDTRKHKKDAANTEHGILMRMFTLARLMGWRDDNPVDGIPYNRTGKRERILSDAEFMAIALAGNQVVNLAMNLGYMLGIRIGDLLDMTWEQVDAGGVYVRQSKNDVQGYYELTDDLKAVLQDARTLHGRNVLITPDLHVIHTRRMRPYTYYGFRAMFRRAVAKSGVKDVRFHDIRRTAITAAAEQGRTPQSFSLHRSARQAENYVVRVPNVTPLRMK